MINPKLFKREEDVTGSSLNCPFSTRIASNIDETITPALLANAAIHSILSDAGNRSDDGIRYLNNAKRNEIITALSEQYEQEILLLTKTKSLDEAIEKLDLQRKKSILKQIV